MHLPVSQIQSVKAAFSLFSTPISLMSNGRIFVNHLRDIAFGCANLIQ